MSQELWVIFVFGLGFLIARVVLAVRFPVPTRDQEAVFRTLLSLAAAGIAAAIPGLMKFESQAAATTISATGALAVFALTYLLNPASARQQPGQPGVDGERGDRGEDFERLVHQIDDLASQVRTLRDRLAQFEASQVNVDGGPAPHRSERRVYSMLILLFSAVLIGALFVFFVWLPAPSAFQTSVLRILFALAGAGLGALLPGMLNVELSGTRVLLRATGALALFVIIYFFAAFS